ncbi:hypothetical protein [Salarchaeum sp. JOR-1]|uniref:hypothetical protein n=1 Tax=Salarchaeum sp. JOR-1 TaxID=2599399 RepID=UPI001198B848|nr:hypothetical protein [Salarchaeum sp. JOR-1]QDX41561.1 hypothetical protein FQU85_11850 [Salarchaeum sp. JOR-1]
MTFPSTGGGATARSVAAVLAVAMLVSTAGCAGLLTDDGGSASAAAQLDSVPANVDSLAFVDVESMLEDDTLRGVANTYFSEMNASSPYYSGPASVSEAIADAENDTGLSATQFETVTAFSNASEQADTDSGSFNGALVTSSLSKTELKSAVTNQTGMEFSTETYGNATIWVPESAFASGSVVGWLGDGAFVTGTESAVKAVVDVRAGDAPAVSGDLRQTFADTRAGYVKFAMTVPQQELDTGPYASETQFASETLNSVQVVSGAFYVEDTDIGGVTHVVTNTSSAATNIMQVMQGALSAYELASEEAAAETLDKIEVTSEGTTVTVSYENAASNIENAIESAYNESSTGSATTTATA